MPIKLKAFIQMAQKSKDRHKTSFAFDLINKKHKKVFRPNLPDIIMVNIISQIKYYSQNHKSQNI